MTWQQLVKRLNAAKAQNQTFARVRNDEIDSLVYSIRCLANLNEQHRKSVEELQAKVERRDRQLLEAINRRIEPVILKVQDEDDDFDVENPEMGAWYANIRESAKRKQMARC